MDRVVVRADMMSDSASPGEPETMPIALAGLWVAWSSDGLRIKGYGRTIEEAEWMAKKSGEDDPILEGAPSLYRC